MNVLAGVEDMFGNRSDDSSASDDGRANIFAESKRIHDSDFTSDSASANQAPKVSATLPTLGLSKSEK